MVVDNAPAAAIWVVPASWNLLITGVKRWFFVAPGVARDGSLDGAKIDPSGPELQQHPTVCEYALCYVYVLRYPLPYVVLITTLPIRFVYWQSAALVSVVIVFALFLLIVAVVLVAVGVHDRTLVDRSSP